ncbi:MAG: hypothetical protein Q7T21_10165 [Gallionella sp.]|nr:hypothetical protein [Gallionella sp.]
MYASAHSGSLHTAMLIDAGLQPISHGKLRLVEAHGTLWSGTGQLDIRDTGGRTGIGRGKLFALCVTAHGTHQVQGV